MSSIYEKFQKCDFLPKKAKHIRWMSFIFSTGLLILFSFFFEALCQELIIVLAFTITLPFFILAIYWKYCDAPSIPKPENTDHVSGDFPELHLQEIILKEFDYARETAAQAMSDRHTLVNFFLIITGVTVTAVSSFVTKHNEAQNIPIFFIVEMICLVFNSIGWIYFLKIIRLRQAWYESASAMNQIKTFFIRHSQISPVISAEAFRWQQHTLPKPEKRSTVFYYSALLVSFISSIALSLAWISAMNPIRLQSLGWVPYLIGLIHFIFQRQMYTIFLAKPEGKNWKSLSKK